MKYHRAIAKPMAIISSLEQNKIDLLMLGEWNTCTEGLTEMWMWTWEVLLLFSRKVDLESKDKSSIVPFLVSEEPVSLELSHHPDKEKVSVLTIYIFWNLLTDLEDKMIINLFLFQILSHCTWLLYHEMDSCICLNKHWMGMCCHVSFVLFLT
jgi:hypothetical protein